MNNKYIQQCANKQQQAVVQAVGEQIHRYVHV